MARRASSISKAIAIADPLPTGLPREIFMQRLQDAVETRTRALEAEGQTFQEQMA